MKFFRKVEVRDIIEQVTWCRSTLGKDVRGGNWWGHRGHLYFNDEKAFVLYSLRWGA